MIYLDTHVVVWLYANESGRFPVATRAYMNEHEWLISPIVRLELQLLREIGRINVPADELIADLQKRVGLRLCQRPFNDVIAYAMQLSWTRDPFDRILVGHASLNNAPLVTKDRTIHEHYSGAMW